LRGKRDRKVLVTTIDDFAGDEMDHNDTSNISPDREHATFCTDRRASVIVRNPDLRLLAYGIRNIPGITEAVRGCRADRTPCSTVIKRKLEGLLRRKQRTTPCDLVGLHSSPDDFAKRGMYDHECFARLDREDAALARCPDGICDS